MPTRRTLLAAALGLVPAAAQASPLGAVNGLNRLFGGRDAQPLARGVAYGPDPRQRLDVWGPAGGSGLPVVIFFYGGSWASGDRGDYRFVADALAREGFIVVIADYRLVPQVRFPGFVADGAAALAWTVRNIAARRGDPARIAVMGHSAGAYIAAMLALDARFAAAAGVPGSIRAFAGLAGPYDFYPFDKPASQAAFGSWPEPRATQPIAFASPHAPPSLLLHGTADDTVRPRNSVALGAALTAAGAAATVALYPGLGHIGILLALARPFGGKAPVARDAAAWLHGAM